LSSPREGLAALSRGCITLYLKEEAKKYMPIREEGVGRRNKGYTSLEYPETRARDYYRKKGPQRYDHQKS